MAEASSGILLLCLQLILRLSASTSDASETGRPATIPLPNFSELEKNYPVPGLFLPSYEGGISNHNLQRKTSFTVVQNFENLRLSWTLNKIGGDHRIQEDSPQAVDSGTLRLPRYAGERDAKSKLFFILHDFEMGPYLTAKYGLPQLRRVSAFKTREQLVTEMTGLRGIVRFILTKGKGAHVGLWSCDTVFYTHNLFYSRKLERVELWPSADGTCKSGR